MANLTRNFTAGRMNKVVDERLVPDGEYIDAMNVRMGSTENSEIGVIENTKGNLALTALSFLDGTPLSVDAVCIGAIADSATETIYWFVHDPNFTSTSYGPNPTGKLDLILSFNTLTNILTYHIISINDGSDVRTVLNFNPKYLITGVNRIGNLLFFTDDYNQPRFINISRNYPDPDPFIDGNGDPALLAESILVIKRPPVEAPSVVLIDQGQENNYLEERFVCFAYRYRYVDGEYSATSQWSAPAFAPGEFAFSPSTYLNEGMVNIFNAAIVSYNTGGPLVVGIDLLFKQANNSVIKVIEKLDKAEMGIPDNAVQTFTFNNSKIFTILPESEILRLYDNVPRLAKAQTIMGNRLMYASYLEGYDLLDKFGNPVRLEYETQLNTEVLDTTNIPYSFHDASYNYGGVLILSDMRLHIDLTGVDLSAGSSITIEATLSHFGYAGDAPAPTDTSHDVSFNFSFVLPVNYTSVLEMVNSPEFQNTVGTASNILPVYSPIPGDDTSCDGTTFTDRLNCLFPDQLATPNTFGSVTKYDSGINGPNQPIEVDVNPLNLNIVRFQFPIVRYVDDPTSISQNVYDLYRLTQAEVTYQIVSSSSSLHSNRGYEIGIVYMDEFGRSSTALVSPYNIEHVPCSNSVTRNTISVLIPTSQRAPGWAKRYKFVCKADAENYETIYSSIFFTASTTNDVYFLLEGENTRKVENGDRYIVKRDTSGPLSTCAYATVLEKDAKQAGFIVTQEGVAPPAGVYMKMKPDSFQATQPANSVINPGQIVTNENDGGEFPTQDYPMNIWNGSAWVDYTVPAGSRIRLEFKIERRGTGDGNNSCERRIYTLDVTLTASANYDNMYDWWLGDDIASILNSGISEVGGTGNCPITNVFIPTLGIPTPDICTNYFRFYRYGNNQLVLKITGTVRCAGITQADKRRSSIISRVTVFRANALVVFETFPTDTLPDVFFENNLSFPIDDNGNHLSNGVAGDVSQDIATGVPGLIQTGFFNCFTFGNGVESYKIRDSIIGRSFNLGNRVTSVSAQDFKAADRFADITYSGVFNQETNVNKLNEFNLGLANFKNLEISFGRIYLIDGRQTDVLVLQEDKISYVLAGKNLLSDAAAGGAITSVPEVLGTQIARIEKYGISFNPESYVQWGYDRYFTDVKRGTVIQMRGDSYSNDQLIVVSENGMRTWFRDEFIDKFNTQKIGGYDPYMNEYVLSINDKELPGPDACVDCGVSQTFTLSQQGEEEAVFSYCVNLGANIGDSTVTWVVTSIGEGSSFNISSDYDGNIVSSGTQTEDGSMSFSKDSNSIDIASIGVSYFGDVVVTITVSCPEPEQINLIRVVITSDSDALKSTHVEYRYLQGVYVGPLQSTQVLFGSSPSDPLVSYYNSISGNAGEGAFPTAGSNVVMRVNKIPPDNFTFLPLENKFRYLRTTMLYNNTPVEISNLVAASSIASPITTSGNINSASFIMPPSSAGNYLYLIYDLRNSTFSQLCYTEEESPESFKSICCGCGPCDTAYVYLKLTNISNFEDAEVYFPGGFPSNPSPAIVTLDPEESVVICVNNVDYQIATGKVIVSVEQCDCAGCSQYLFFGNDKDGPSVVEFFNCDFYSTSITLNNMETAMACVHSSSTPTVTSGDVTITQTNPIGCCSPNPPSCLMISGATECAGAFTITLTQDGVVNGEPSFKGAVPPGEFGPCDQEIIIYYNPTLSRWEATLNGTFYNDYLETTGSCPTGGPWEGTVLNITSSVCVDCPSFTQCVKWRVTNNTFLGKSTMITPCVGAPYNLSLAPFSSAEVCVSASYQFLNGLLEYELLNDCGCA